MRNAINIRQTGFKQVDEVLKKLPAQVRRRVMISIAKEAAKPLVRDMQNGFDRVAEPGTGKSRGAIGVKTLRNNKDTRTSIFVGIREGKGWDKYKGFVARFVEMGTDVRTPRRKSVRFLKFKAKDGRIVFARQVAPVQSRPFIGPAIIKNRAQIEKKMAESVAVALNRYMKRTIKRNSK